MWLCIGEFCCVTLMVGRFIELKPLWFLAIGFAGMGLSLFGCWKFLRFWCFRLAELKMALALAVGDQEFNSNEETVQFRLGEPQAGCWEIGAWLVKLEMTQMDSGHSHGNVYIFLSI